MTNIAWALFFVLFPAVILYVCHKSAVMDKIGAAVLCYATGILIGNIGVIPASAAGVQSAFLNYTVPIALPLLFFSLDIKKWSKVAGKSFLSLGFGILAVLISATVAFLVFRTWVGPESWKVAGMLIGCYTGGSPNLAAIGTALQVEPSVYIAVNVADVIVPPIYLLLSMTVLQRILLHVLPPFKRPNTGEGTGEQGMADFTSYVGIFERRRIIPLMCAFLLSIIIFGVGGGLSLAAPKDISMVVAVLAIATLGVLCSFIPAVRRIEMSFQLGQYVILIFCLAVSSLADISKMIESAPVMMGFVFIAVFLAASIHVLLSAVFRIDADTMIITSIAAIFSPPFVPMVASALKNRLVLFTGIITGIVGWVIGTYLGISYAYVLKYLFM